MAYQPDDFLISPKPSEFAPSTRRLDLFMRIGVANAVFDLVLRVGAVTAVLAVVSAGPSSSAGSGSTCSSLTSAEVSAVLGEIASLQASEAAIRRRLTGPGLIIPKNLETYR